MPSADPASSNVSASGFASPVSPVSRSRGLFRRIVACRHGGATLVFLLFIAVAFLTRTALLFKAARQVDWNGSLAGAFLTGLVFDAGAGLFVAAPFALVAGALPARVFSWRGARWTRAVAHGVLAVVLGALLFGAVAEWFFWDEFGVRFNFIAVDYLVYTQEVIGNIRESYPMPVILSGLVLASGVLTWLLARTGLVALWLDAPAAPARRRWLVTAGWIGATALAATALDSRRLPAFENAYNGELARNGLWSLFAAFRNNELDYARFYATLPDDEAFGILHRELARDGSTPVGTPEARDTLRFVSGSGSGPEQRPNVIQITVESLSASFLGAVNPKSTLTPNLDALIPKSLYFENFYATGNRTDRGMEALTLSLPPTPGRSLVKRPANAGLFTLGSVFRSRGYDTAFIYSGYGYFDNMNAFFGGNGYRIIDRASVDKRDITFANAWGACDEDLLRWTLREADAGADAGQPFHYFVMTTSNHRPFTYPEGRIDLPPKVSKRAGAVKYTDHAIGEFIRAASGRPWFRNTVFVIVADHCASSAGKTELPVQNYHIPLIIYAPGGQIAPGRVSRLASQIDYAPTLLGRLGWSYATRFFGRDVLRDEDGGLAGHTNSADRGGGRALVGNYQKLGFYEPGQLTVLSPRRGVHQYAFDPATALLVPENPDTRRRDEAIAYYQAASWLYRHGRYRAVPASDQARWSARYGRNEEGEHPAGFPASGPVVPALAANATSAAR
ncbi:phosphoglycerol transferase family protein, alkaline phosphatase superfamily [Opitutaceae bacterium TAV1]|nr:phosphoglycerol transferase family protein, alkaline phosphatase superfamily [Opitutaceae bacterium TAV1]